MMVTALHAPGGRAMIICTFHTLVSKQFIKLKVMFWNRCTLSALFSQLGNWNMQVLKDLPWWHTDSEEMLKDSNKGLTTRPHLSNLHSLKRNTVLISHFLLLYTLPVMSVYETSNKSKEETKPLKCSSLQDFSQDIIGEIYIRSSFYPVLKITSEEQPPLCVL